MKAQGVLLLLLPRHTSDLSVAGAWPRQVNKEQNPAGVFGCGDGRSGQAALGRLDHIAAVYSDPIEPTVVLPEVAHVLHVANGLTDDLTGEGADGS